MTNAISSDHRFTVDDGEEGLAIVWETLSEVPGRSDLEAVAIRLLPETSLRVGIDGQLRLLLRPH